MENRGKNIKDIEDLKILLDINEREIKFIAETDKETKEIVIKF